MTTHDTRTEAERKYDMERSGELYTTPTEPERSALFHELKAWIDEQCDADDAIEEKFIGISMSPGCGDGGGWLEDVPILAIIDDVPTIRPGGSTDEELAEVTVTDAESLLPQRVHEVVRLTRRGLVVLDAEHEVFVMTAAEFAAQTSDDNKEGNEAAERLAALPIEDRLFAKLVTDWLDQVPKSHWAMGQAGMILLAAAADAIGPSLRDDASAAEAQEEIQARIFQAAYTQGYEEGRDKGFDECLDILKAEQAARTP